MHVQRHVKDGDFFRCVYRMGDEGCVNWACLVRGPGPKQAAERPDAVPQAPTRVEYLRAVLKPPCYYSFSRDAPAIPVEDIGPQIEQTVYFQIIRLHSPQERPHVIPTEDTRTDVTFNSALALRIQYYSRWTCIHSYRSYKYINTK